MPDTRISDLTVLTAPAAGDLIPIVDISDTTMAASGTTKRVTQADLAASFSPNWAAPGTIGSTTPNTGAFTSLSATGITTVASGTALLPSIVSTTGTADTGLWFPAADTLAASTAGSERIRISSTGNVGIPTTSPTAMLHIVPNADATKAIFIKGAASQSGDAFHYANSSNVMLAKIDSAGTITSTTDAYFNGARVGLGGGGSTANFVGGVSAGASLTTGINTVAIGNNALGTATTAASNVGIGWEAGRKLTSEKNVAIGSAALHESAAAGGSSVAVGYQCLYNALGTGNVGLGANAGARETGANSFYIGNVLQATEADDRAYSLLYGTFSGAAASLTGQKLIINGNVGIGTTSLSYLLHVNTDSAGKPGAGGLWTVVSDERIKTDIVPADLSRCYDIVKQVGLKHFGFKPGVYSDEQINDKHSLGWIAQDVQKVFGKAVSIKPFTLQTDIPDGTEEYEEQEFTVETVNKLETSIQVINGKPVQVSKVVTSENKVMLFDMVDVLDESGAAVMEGYEVTPAIAATDATEEVEAVIGTRPVTYQMPRMVTKTRPKVRREVIEDCLDLNGGQMNAALYGAVQCLMAKVEAQAVTIASLQRNA